MPLYEYKCRKCGNTFEVLQKFSDKPLATHEACGGEVERLISPPAIQFKGTGWYVTDYAKKNGSEKAGATKSDAKPSGAPSSSESSASGPESKPGASTESSAPKKSDA